MANKMVYEWGSRSFSVDAQIVGEAVEGITQAHGYCEPRQLIEMAASDDSPLHPLFTWDDTKAAENWRTHEARKVISSVIVTVKVDDQELTAPAFLSVGHVIATQDAGEGYRPLHVVAADADFTEEAMQEALTRLRALRRRYAAIKALAPVWKAIETVEAAD